MDLVLIDNDEVIFDPVFAPAIVMVKPGKLRGSGSAKIRGQKICVAGDERDVEVRGCAYTSGDFNIPGTGRLKITDLASDQLSKRVKSNSRYVLLQGGRFMAVFEVEKPAMMMIPAMPPQPDPMPRYIGRGTFSTSNRSVKTD